MQFVKQHGGTLARVAVTVLGLWLAARSLDFRTVVETLSKTQWNWVFVGFMLVNISLVLRAYRWLILLRGAGVRQLSFGRLVELYFVGNFFNAFLPSGFGGDAVRVVEAAQEIPADVATGSVFLDRFTGLLVLFVMGLVALPFRPNSFPQSWALGIALFCFIGIVGGVILLDGRLIRHWGRWLPRSLSPIGDGIMAKFLRAVQGCGRQAVWGAIAVSALFDALLIGWWTAAAWALNASVPITYNLLVVPIFAVALMIPSIGGLGPPEALADPLYAGANLAAGTPLAIALLVFIMLRAAGLLGAPLYIYTIFRKRAPIVQPNQPTEVN